MQAKGTATSHHAFNNFWDIAGIYFLASDGTVWLLIVYSKAKFDNLPASFLAQLKKGVEDAI